MHPMFDCLEQPEDVDRSVMNGGCTGWMDAYTAQSFVSQCYKVQVVGFFTTLTPIKRYCCPAVINKRLHK